jgi:hypothetical protein
MREAIRVVHVNATWSAMTVGSPVAFSLFEEHSSCEGLF